MMKKVAIFLPIGYKGGTLRAAKNIAKAISYQAKKHGDDIQVVFSYVEEGDNYHYSEFADLLRENIDIRETQWCIFTKDQLATAALLMKKSEILDEFDTFCLPIDGANDFYDCDLWVIISDRLPAPLFPLKKTVFFIYDYIQRYVPGIFNDMDSAWDSQVANLFVSVRNASRVFVTTPSTQSDLISYAGVSKSRICLLEMDFQPLEVNKSEINLNYPSKYFIWTTNTTLHKNHENAIEAFTKYVYELNGTLNMVVCGKWTKYFDPNYEFEEDSPFRKIDHILNFRRKIQEDPELGNKIHIIRYVSDKIYAHYLQNAQFLFHPAFYDNGTYSVIEAAYLGVPSLSAKYPAMEYINQKFKLNINFFDPNNSFEIAMMMKKMEDISENIPLPDKSSLAKANWKTHSKTLYDEIVSLINW